MWHFDTEWICIESGFPQREAKPTSEDDPKHTLRPPTTPLPIAVSHQSFRSGTTGLTSSSSIQSQIRCLSIEPSSEGEHWLGLLDLDKRQWKWCIGTKKAWCSVLFVCFAHPPNPPPPPHRDSYQTMLWGSGMQKMAHTHKKVREHKDKKDKACGMSTLTIQGMPETS